MAVKEKNKIINITLTPMHQRKLDMVCNRTGFKKTEVFQRLLEQHTAGMLVKKLLGEAENPPPLPSEEVENIT